MQRLVPIYLITCWQEKMLKLSIIKGRSCQLRPKAHMLDDPLVNPYDVLKVLLWPPYGPYKGPLWPFIPP